MKKRIAELRAGMVLVGFLLSAANGVAAQPQAVRLSHHVAQAWLGKVRHIGRSPDRAMNLTVAVAFRDEPGLQSFVSRVSDPRDPLYGSYMTPAQVLLRFGPSADDMAVVKRGLADQGLNVTGQLGHLIFVSGTTRSVEQAFAIEIHDYATASSEIVFSNTSDPLVSIELGARISVIAGLENIVRAKSHIHLQDRGPQKQTIGTGALGGMSPSDIAKAYLTTASALTGTGQTLGLFELDGYTASDITQYGKLYGVAAPTLRNILVDNFSGQPGSGAVEVTLDIELMSAVAPGAGKILVYEGPNTSQGSLDTYTKIANDNLASVVSSSWGSPEDETTTASMKAENTIFMQMAAQGQTVFVAAGDSGAYSDGKNLVTDDPGSQPYVTAAGGTTLSVNADGSFKSESSWGIPANGKNALQGGGGGISSIWTIPAWQSALGTTANKGSSTMRMVPDIALNANPSTGYALVFQGANDVVGGTSCVAPIWAAFTAIVNEKRAASQLPNVGFINPALYQLGQSSLYSQILHDVNDGSTNLFYPAVTGYDLSTGWGSANFASLFTALTNAVLPPLAPTLTAKPYNQIAILNWTASAGASTYTLYRSTSATGPFIAVQSALTEPMFVDVNLTDGTTYFYYVMAVDAAGTSGNSNMVTVTPTLVVPEAPTNLSYTVVNP